MILFPQLLEKNKKYENNLKNLWFSHSLKFSNTQYFKKKRAKNAFNCFSAAPTKCQKKAKYFIIVQKNMEK